MADVVIQARLEEDVREMLRNMLPSAVARAMERAKDDITSYAWDITPKRTMRLANSFRVAITLGPTATVHMYWDAEDPKTGFGYAKVVDEGRPGGRQRASDRGAGMRRRRVVGVRTEAS